MIIGIGEDICDIRRLNKVLTHHGDRFLNRSFTPAERAKAATRHGINEPASTLAKRFAAKEACAKALKTGIAHGVYLRDIGVENDASGAPTLRLTGGAAKILASLTPPNHKINIHLTLSDEYPYARAFVILEAIRTEHDEQN